MKPESLSKILPELIEGFVDDYEKGYVDRDDLIDGLATHIELEVKKRVEWILKEIEKRENINFVMDELKVRWLDSEWWEGYCYALDWFKNLIKQAFSGVIE